MKKFSFFAVAAAMLAMLMTGCGNTQAAAPAEPAAVAYVVANTANAKPVDISAPLLNSTAQDCAASFGYTFVVRVDGEPDLSYQKDMDIGEQFKQASKERLALDAKNNAQVILKELERVTPHYAEVDFLEGIRCAAKALNSLDDSYTSRTIVCWGSGLSTTGYLDFRNNLLSASPEQLVQMLQERDALPNLQGITVHFLGLGQVCSPQPKLNAAQEKNLEAIWTAIVEASGGTFKPNSYISVTATETDSIPAVSVVELPQEVPCVIDFEEGDTANLLAAPLALTEEQVHFVGDQASYLHPEEAEQSLQPIADFLLRNSSVNVLLVGSTAGDGTNEFTLKLSKARAETVRQSLISMGVEPGRITAVGMGANDPWHIKNIPTTDPGAKVNRKVVLLDASDELAQRILAGA